MQHGEKANMGCGNAKSPLPMTKQLEDANPSAQDRILAEIVHRLVSSFAPQKIVLFGSRAAGEARPDSDFDLLIVWRDEHPPAARAAAIRESLLDIGVPMNIAVVTPSEFNRLRSRRTHIVAIADREGKILYAASPQGSRN